MSTIFASTPDSVTLKNPEYGDSLQHDTNVLFHISMTGSVYSYKKKLKRTLLLNYNGLTRTEIDNFKTFYTTHIADELTYTDSISEVYTCRFVNNILETIVPVGSGTCELYNITVQLSVSAIA